MNNQVLQFGNISGVFSLQRHPQDMVIIGDVPQALDIDTLKSFLNIYDQESDGVLGVLMQATQEQAEGYAGVDSTPRVRRAYWQAPQSIIELPYGPHANIDVEQMDGDGNWNAVNPNDYRIFGERFVTIALTYLYPTRVTYTSGSAIYSSVFRAVIMQEVSYQYKNRSDPSVAQSETTGLTPQSQAMLNTIRKP